MIKNFNKKLISVEIFLGVLLLSVVLITGINSKNKIATSKVELNLAYEKGLYDGFFKTIQHIENKGYFQLGTIEFTLPEVDSLLHVKN